MSAVLTETEEIVKKAKSLGADEVMPRRRLANTGSHVLVTMRLPQLSHGITM